MTDLLLRLFVKHASDTSDPAVRAGYGRLAGVTGIVCNLLLFALKLLAGTISGCVCAEHRDGSFARRSGN